MSKRWIVILLLISLAFNLAVMGMFISITIFHRPPCPLPEEGNPRWGHGPDRPQGMGMPPMLAQRFGFNREKIMPCNIEFSEKRTAFLATLAKSDFSEQEARLALNQSLAAHQKLEAVMGNDLIELRKKMTPEEAHQVFEKMLKRARNVFPFGDGPGNNYRRRMPPREDQNQ